MTGGSRKSKSSSSTRNRQLRISYVENDGAEQQFNKRERASSSSKRSSHRSSGRRARVHPESTTSRMSDRAKIKPRSSSKRLSVDTNNNTEDERRQSTATSSSKTSTPNSSARDLRTSRDLRSPGVAQTPVAKIAKLPQGQPLPDFITQTDANGNATTPRSAKAIEGAKKGAPNSGSSRPNFRKDRRPNEDDGSDTDKSDTEGPQDPCDTLLEGFYMMCCCLGPGGDVSSKEGRELKQGGTQDTADDKVRLLGPFHKDDQGKKCLVLDLDETLVHSSFRPVPNADFVIPVPIEDVVHFVYVMKRPGVDEFLLEMAKHYEIVIYTASLNKYADPLLDLLDPHRVIRYRLFREHCAYYEGNYVKDLNLLDRDLTQTIIIDNSPSSYLFHPENAIDCSSFIDDPRDRELDQIGAFLAGIRSVQDVRGVCTQWRDWPVVDIVGAIKGDGEEQQQAR